MCDLTGFYNLELIRDAAFAADIATGAPPEDQAPELNCEPCPGCPFVGDTGEAEFKRCATCEVVFWAAAPEERS